jgi:hypothetical protein
MTSLKFLCIQVCLVDLFTTDNQIHSLANSQTKQPTTTGLVSACSIIIPHSSQVGAFSPRRLRQSPSKLPSSSNSAGPRWCSNRPLTSQEAGGGNSVLTVQQQQQQQQEICLGRQRRFTYDAVLMRT